MSSYVLNYTKTSIQIRFLPLLFFLFYWKHGIIAHETIAIYFITKYLTYEWLDKFFFCELLAEGKMNKAIPQCTFSTPPGKIGGFHLTSSI